MGFPCFDADSEELVARLLPRERRVLLMGAPGTGKSWLTEGLARVLEAAGRPSLCLSADPGTPAFGVPGTVSLAVRENAHWRVVAWEALCTLDAGRFRLPLVTALQRLVTQAPATTLLIDAPGAVRGVTGSELLHGLLAATAADLVLVLVREETAVPLFQELRAQAAEVVLVRAVALAQRPGKKARARARTAAWDEWLREPVMLTFALSSLRIIGTPPPLTVPAAWIGRQVALSDAVGTTVLGEVQAMTDASITLRLSHPLPAPQVLLVRGAQRLSSGLLETAPVYAAEPLVYLPPPDVTPFARVAAAGGPWISGEVGPLSVILVNGVFGDPLLYARLRYQRRSLLFDLGASVRLAARVAHHVTDVFISHAHLDHLGGFFWLLRARLGEFPLCRLYGPPGLAQRIEALIHGILWDRVAEHGPRFEIAELHGERLLHYFIQVGKGDLQFRGKEPLQDDVIRCEPGFRVRAVTLDHHTPVLAYAFEPAQQINIRKDRLHARRWPPGPWLTELKQRLNAGEREAPIRLPDGSDQTVGALADELALILPGRKLVYATDLADTPQNRERLVAFAQGAHTLFCEAPFLEEDTEQAARTGHLTTRACGEIAAAADVTRLVPFHFSLRNSDRPDRVYDEIRAVCSRVALPQDMQVFNSFMPDGP